MLHTYKTITHSWNVRSLLRLDSSYLCFPLQHQSSVPSASGTQLGSAHICHFLLQSLRAFRFLPLHHNPFPTLSSASFFFSPAINLEVFPLHPRVPLALSLLCLPPSSLGLSPFRLKWWVILGHFFFSSLPLS